MKLINILITVHMVSACRQTYMKLQQRNRCVTHNEVYTNITDITQQLCTWHCLKNTACSVMNYNIKNSVCRFSDDNCVYFHRDEDYDAVAINVTGTCFLGFKQWRQYGQCPLLFLQGKSHRIYFCCPWHFCWECDSRIIRALYRILHFQWSRDNIQQSRVFGSQRSLFCRLGSIWLCLCRFFPNRSNSWRLAAGYTPLHCPKISGIPKYPARRYKYWILWQSLWLRPHGLRRCWRHNDGRGNTSVDKLRQFITCQ